MLDTIPWVLSGKSVHCKAGDADLPVGRWLMTCPLAGDKAEVQILGSHAVSRNSRASGECRPCSSSGLGQGGAIQLCIWGVQHSELLVTSQL